MLIVGMNTPLTKPILRLSEPSCSNKKLSQTLSRITSITSSKQDPPNPATSLYPKAKQRSRTNTSTFSMCDLHHPQRLQHRHLLFSKPLCLFRQLRQFLLIRLQGLALLHQLLPLGLQQLQYKLRPCRGYTGLLYICLSVMLPPAIHTYSLKHETVSEKPTTLPCHLGFSSSALIIANAFCTPMATNPFSSTRQRAWSSLTLGLLLLQNIAQGFGIGIA